MITVAIKDNGEKNVIKLTQENLARELQDIAGARLIVVDDWMDALDATKNDFICFVEADCLVSSGYFSSLVGIFRKDTSLRKLAVLGSATGVLNWANRIYGYSLSGDHEGEIIPERTAASTVVYTNQFAYIPGAIMRTKMLRQAIDKLEVERLKSADDDDSPLLDTDNLVELSIMLSSMFWMLGDGHRVAINPNTSYATTEAYVQEPVIGDFDTSDLVKIFKKAGIE